MSTPDDNVLNIGYFYCDSHDSTLLIWTFWWNACDSNVGCGYCYKHLDTLLYLSCTYSCNISALKWFKLNMSNVNMLCTHVCLTEKPLRKPQKRLYFSCAYSNPIAYGWYCLLAYLWNRILSVWFWTLSVWFLLLF